jgi:hypothetical protein
MVNENRQKIFRSNAKPQQSRFGSPQKTPEQSRLLSTMMAEILYTNHDPVAQYQFPAFQTNSGNRYQCHAAHEQD